MALLATQTVSPGGVKLTLSAGASSQTVDCSNGRTLFRVVNGSGGSINVTRTTPSTDADGNAITDPVTAVPNGETWDFWLNPNTLGSIATVALSGTSSVTVAAYSF